MSKKVNGNKMADQVLRFFHWSDHTGYQHGIMKAGSKDEVLKSMGHGHIEQVVILPVESMQIILNKLGDSEEGMQLRQRMREQGAWVDG